MNKVEQLLVREPGGSYPGPPNPEVNPFVHTGALDECVFVDLRFDPIRGTCAVLLDVRSGLRPSVSNAAVLVARGVERFSWDRADAVTPRRSWAVVGADYRAGRLTSDMALEFWPGAVLNVTAEEFELWFGEVAGLDGIPDLTEADDDLVTQGYPRWHSEFTAHAYVSDRGTEAL